MIHYFCITYGSMITLQYFDHKAYTKLSFIVFLYAIFEYEQNMQTELFSLLYQNYLAINTSFHLAFILDASAFQRLAISMNISQMRLLLYDFCFHIIPCVVSKQLMRSYQKQYFTLIVHLSWAFISNKCCSLDLSRVYIPMQPHHWQIMWFFTILAHLLYYSIAMIKKNVLSFGLCKISSLFCYS